MTNGIQKSFIHIGKEIQFSLKKDVPKLISKKSVDKTNKRKANTMKFAIYLPNFGPFGDARVISDWALAAENAGWDGFFIWDHLTRAWPADAADPWIALSAAAVQTQRVRLGAMVTPLARRRPWKVAREAESLDRLSGGRLVLGVGLGSSGGASVEWDNFGEEMDLKMRAGMLDEALEIIDGLWSGQPFSLKGKHYQVKESQFLPKPLQLPRIPVWVAGYWPNRAPFRRMARWDGMFPQFQSAVPDEMAALSEAIRYTLSHRMNTQPFEVVYSVSPEKAANLAGGFASIGVTWLLVELYPVHFGSGWQDAVWPLDAMREHLEAGPPTIE